MPNLFFGLGSLAALVAVGAGAFGAHALADQLTAARLATFETAVRYHVIHALGLLAVAWAAAAWPGRTVHVAGWAFVTGILIFSGSLYALVLSGIRWLGAITPIGGAAFLVGWMLLAWHAWRGGIGR